MFEQKNRWMPVLVGSLLLLLPALAVVQYRWIGRVSEAEAARMRANLQTSVVRFSEDLDQALEQVHDAFIFTVADYEKPVGRVLREHDAAWRQAVPEPQLLRAVYWVDYEGPGPRLYRLEDTTFAQTAWTADLAPWRAYFDPAPAPDARLPGSPLGMSIPTSRPGTISGPADNAEPASRIGYVLLLLDTGYLYGSFFPTLAGRYFSGGRQMEHDLRLVSTDDTTRVCFQTDPTLTDADFASPDVMVEIGQLKRLILELTQGDGATSTQIKMLRQGLRVQGVEAELVIDDASITEEALVTSTVEGWSEKTARGEVRAGLPEMVTPPALTPPRGLHGWRLLLRHRTGSLEAAVAQARRRNLAVSFGILLVLGAATGLIVVSSQRARQLAGQQMAFVAGVSHELRTPLAVICSAAENLADGVVRDPEQAGRYGVLIRDEGRRLTEMVEQVLGLAAAGSGQRTYDLTPVPLRAILARAEADCRHALEAAGATLERRIPDALPSVRADAEALSAALCNLLQNAAKYGEAGGRVILEAAPDDGAMRVAITVRDDGPGIPADELPHLFEPFFRGRTARAAQIHGNGLGLSLVHHTVTAHGGRITVESTPGRGSAFTIYLPTLAEAGR